MVIESICKLLNASFGWKPGTAEEASFFDICEYYHILISKLGFELDHDWNKYMDNIYPLHYKVLVTGERLRCRKVHK